MFYLDLLTILGLFLDNPYDYQVCEWYLVACFLPKPISGFFDFCVYLEFCNNHSSNRLDFWMFLILTLRWIWMRRFFSSFWLFLWFDLIWLLIYWVLVLSPVANIWIWFIVISTIHIHIHISSSSLPKETLSSWSYWAWWYDRFYDFFHICFWMSFSKCGFCHTKVCGYSVSMNYIVC